MSVPKRKFKRVKVDVRVRIRRWEEPEDAASVVRTYELSEGGMSVYASESLDVGTFMLIELSLPPAKQSMRIRAVVRNRKGFRCGLEFLDLPNAERSQLLHYLTEVEGVVEI